VMFVIYLALVLASFAAAAAESPHPFLLHLFP
jgi:hypothetical protein